MNTKKNKKTQVNNKHTKGGDPCVRDSITQINTSWKSTL